jgi:hypothetical protein
MPWGRIARPYRNVYNNNTVVVGRLYHQNKIGKQLKEDDGSS